MNELRASAPAKLNLALAVVGRRDDGYHELRSVFVRLALHDELSVELAPDRDGPERLAVEGDAAAPITDNIVLRAAALVRAALGADPAIESPLPALAFTLAKGIPVRAGLGGGSSDAAAAIDLALRAWGRSLDAAARRSLAARLGADVPFFDGGMPAALVSGIGDRLEPLPPADPPAGAVLVSPREGLSTAAVFAAYDAAPSGRVTSVAMADRLAAILRERSGAAALARTLETVEEVNDLWLPAVGLAPDLGLLRDRLYETCGRRFHLTGSGSTLFSVTPSLAEAETAAALLRAALPIDLDRATVNITITEVAAPDAEGVTT